MRALLFLAALIGFLTSAGCVVAATKFVAWPPFYWEGVAALAATAAFGLYLAVEGRALLGDPDDDHAP